MRLPDELILYILAYADTHALLAVACTSRRLRRLADDELLWAEHSRRWVMQLKHTCHRTLVATAHDANATCKQRFLASICHRWPRCQAVEPTLPVSKPPPSWFATVLQHVPRLIGRTPSPPPMQIVVAGSGIDAHDYSLISALMRNQPGPDCPFRQDGFGELPPASGQSAGIRIGFRGRPLHVAAVFLGNARERRIRRQFAQGDPQRLSRHHALLADMSAKADAVLFMMDARHPLSQIDLDDLKLLKELHSTAPLAVALMRPGYTKPQDMFLDVAWVSRRLADVVDRPWSVNLVDPHSYHDLSLLFSWMVSA